MWIGQYMLQHLCQENGMDHPTHNLHFVSTKLDHRYGQTPFIEEASL